MSDALDTVSILEKLVSFPSVSRDENRPLIDWIRNYLADQGIDSHVVPDATGRKANLFATVGPNTESGVVLSGHTDVVPVDGQAWSSDPFVLSSRGSRLYARGACDMKGFIAAVLAGVPHWRSAKLRRPIHLMFSYDEEVGCLGVRSMIDAAKRVIATPAAVLVGEPTGMRMADSHKGIRTLRTAITGIEAHSSLTHQGVSAVMLAAEMIVHLRVQAQLKATASQLAPGGLEPPYTTVSVNQIKGGTAVNILARECEFVWDIRAIPGESADAIASSFAEFGGKLLGVLSREARGCAIHTKTLADVPSLTKETGLAARLVGAAITSKETSIAVPFATEGGLFQAEGWSTVVCGPGSIEQAHKPDEYIDRAQLVQCEGLLRRLVTLHCEQ